MTIFGYLTALFQMQMLYSIDHKWLVDKDLEWIDRCLFQGTYPNLSGGTENNLVNKVMITGRNSYRVTP
jgi:hypothetical protein